MSLFKDDFILRCLNLKMSLFKDDCLELFPTSDKQFCKSAKNFENQKRYFSSTLKLKGEITVEAILNLTFWGFFPS